MAQAAKALQVKGQTDHLGRACRSKRVEPFISTAMCKPTSTCMIGSSSIHNRILAFLTFIPVLQYLIGGFQDASAQGTEGLAMKQSKLVKMPLHGSHRV